MKKGKDLLYELDQLVDEGFMNKQSHKTLPLAVYCYSNKATYEEYWNEYTKFARGVVLNKSTGEVVSKPFSKFFNWSERHSQPIPSSYYYDVFEKLDGSMCAVSFFEGKPLITTKCSFDNLYIDFASQYMDRLKRLSSLNWTAIFEVIPEEDEMSRAVKHEPELYLIGGTELTTGIDLHPNSIDYEGPRAKLISGLSIDDLLVEMNNSQNIEGWVVRFANGHRVKIKTDWYLRMFRAIHRMDALIKEELIKGKSKEDIILNIEEEYREEVLEILSDFERIVMERVRNLEDKFDNIVHMTNSRKEFAMALHTSYKNDEDINLLFNILDGKPIINEVVKRAIKGGDYERVKRQIEHKRKSR